MNAQVSPQCYLRVGNEQKICWTRACYKRNFYGGSGRPCMSVNRGIVCTKDRNHREICRVLWESQNCIIDG